SCAACGGVRSRNGYGDTRVLPGDAEGGVLRAEIRAVLGNDEVRGLRVDARPASEGGLLRMDCRLRSIS
ncbi:hypothetical protein PPTG_21616, partial [Phytophthora nicotianae INRA-310]